MWEHSRLSLRHSRLTMLKQCQGTRRSRTYIWSGRIMLVEKLKMYYLTDSGIKIERKNRGVKEWKSSESLKKTYERRKTPRNRCFVTQRFSSICPNSTSKSEIWCRLLWEKESCRRSSTISDRARAMGRKLRCWWTLVGPSMMILRSTNFTFNRLATNSIIRVKFQMQSLRTWCETIPWNMMYCKNWPTLIKKMIILALVLPTVGTLSWTRGTLARISIRVARTWPESKVKLIRNTSQTSIRVTLVILLPTSPAGPRFRKWPACIHPKSNRATARWIRIRTSLGTRPLTCTSWTKRSNRASIRWWRSRDHCPWARSPVTWNRTYSRPSSLIIFRKVKAAPSPPMSTLTV